MLPAGPRIYNLFPLLVGAAQHWAPHIRRAGALGFNWLFINPIHETGGSGSLYSIRDYERFNPAFFPEDDGARPQDQLSGVVRIARDAGLSVMADLVINHTAIDSLLVESRPHWYRRDDAGGICKPGAVDPADTSNVTIWHDLAELNYDHPDVMVEMLAYWAGYIKRMAALGITGFRCDAAYKVPAQAWRQLFAMVRADVPEARFFAETLGCSAEETESLAGCGFDYFYNSSKWWDFKSPWLLDQYESLRHVAPSISFPESHDTERLAAASADPGHAMREAKLRYLFAACFGSGVMMPIGYEFGFRKPLDVVKTAPGDWEKTFTDISDAIAAGNKLKAGEPVLNVEGPVRMLSTPGVWPLALLREKPDRQGEALLLLINPDRAVSAAADAGLLIAALGRSFARFEDITPQSTPQSFLPGAEINLEPLEMRIIKAVPAKAMKPAKSTDPKSAAATARVAIENIAPIVDAGRYAVKRIIGDVVTVSADIFSDGHGKLRARVKYKGPRARDWSTAPMLLIDNDRWQGEIPLLEEGDTCFTVEAWHDEFATWQSDLRKKVAAGQTTNLYLEEGAALIEHAVAQAGDACLAEIKGVLAAMGEEDRVKRLLEPGLGAFMDTWGGQAFLTTADTYYIHVARTAARFSAWYELFPRSATDDPARHGTLRDVIDRLDYVRDLGFDVLYFTPIHPIGRTNRKGRNNTLTPAPDDPGSPYAIGAAEGGHDALHPELGTMDDFRALVREARNRGIEIALDFAIQASLDHPWIKQHPEWFEWRSDGTIKYAENPPKRYEDIVNVQFYGNAFPGAWLALKDIVLFWAGEGVRNFRVDNPHTKPLPFWEWLIAETRKVYPDLLFLSEAFTRPKMMQRLAKLGFDQSYSYFTWRNTKGELTSYLTELTTLPVSDFYRPNFFANTPDINPVYLQTSGRPGFMIRAVLAGTLGTSWGISSGFELCEAAPLPGREEFINSEKYEIKAWDWDRPGNIRDYITRLNRIRRENPALQLFTNLRFHTAHHDQVLFYSKAVNDNIVWIAVSLDPHNVVDCTLELPLGDFALSEDLMIDDLIHGHGFKWHGATQQIRFDPSSDPCHIWRPRLAHREAT